MSSVKLESSDMNFGTGLQDSVLLKTQEGVQLAEASGTLRSVLWYPSCIFFFFFLITYFGGGERERLERKQTNFRKLRFHISRN